MALTSTVAGGHGDEAAPKFEAKWASEDLDDLMSIDQLASYTGIPKNTLYYWRAQGSGPRGMKLGKYVRYRRSDIQAWLSASLERDR